MAKVVSLNISERYRVLVLLNEFKGNMETLVSLQDDVKKLRIEDAEWEKAERKINKVKGADGTETEQWNWNDEKGGEKEIDLEKETAKYLKEAIDKKDKANEITLQDIVLISISKKLA